MKIASQREEASAGGEQGDKDRLLPSFLSSFPLLLLNLAVDICF